MVNFVWYICAACNYWRVAPLVLFGCLAYSITLCPAEGVFVGHLDRIQERFDTLEASVQPTTNPIDQNRELLSLTA